MQYSQQRKMPEELDRLYVELLADLEKSQGEADNALDAAERCLACCEIVMKSLWIWLFHHEFAHDEEEIHFFKHIKPAFHSQELYYDAVLDLELHRPRGGVAIVSNYFSSHLEAVQARIAGQEDLYFYIRSGGVGHDQQYFLRFWRKTGFPADSIQIAGNPVFETLMSDRVAMMMRDDLLVDYLEDQLGAHTVPQGTAEAAPGGRKLKWTGKIKWLGQLSYGLAKSGVLGDASVIEVGRALGYIFNTDLKNLYRANMEDRISKDPGDGIKFILDAYLKDAEDKDLNPRLR
jgi:hypothetical protein